MHLYVTWLPTSSLLQVFSGGALLHSLRLLCLTSKTAYFTLLHLNLPLAAVTTQANPEIGPISFVICAGTVVAKEQV